MVSAFFMARILQDYLSKGSLVAALVAISFGPGCSNNAAQNAPANGPNAMPVKVQEARATPINDATEYVSTSARTFTRPPDTWKYTTWQDKAHWFGGSPQGLSADLIHEGATGASGNVYEPFLAGCARPDYLLPAWYQGRNLADSYYISLVLLSWQGVVLGDPLCSLGKP